MSIEKNLERIADALERIASIVKVNALGDAVIAAATAKPEKVATVAQDLPPGVEDDPQTVTVAAEAAETPGMDGTALRDLAQKYIQVAGDKTGALVNFIKDSVCKKFSPKEPKLVKIPAKDVAAAAKLIEGYCKKQGISLPIEV